jgi:hypothetical protein
MFTIRKTAILQILPCCLLAFAASATFIAGGCGGRQNISYAHTTQTGRAALSVRWPTRSRLVPFAAESVKVRIVRGGAILGEKLLVRPENGGTASASFDRLPTGEVIVQAWAYPQADGSGVAQAQGQVGVTILNGQTVPVHLTLDSTIENLTITPAGPHSLSIGSGLQLATTAKNAAGEIVVTHTSKIEWQSSNPAVATVDPAGWVQAVASGTTTIQVTETESGKTATVTVNCGPSSGSNDNFDDNTLDNSLWKVITLGTGPTLAEVNQRLEMTIPAHSTGFPLFGIGYQTQKVFRGDFDVQVDYRLLDWPATNGTRMGIWLGDNPNQEHIATAHRVSLNASEFGTDPRESHTGTNATPQWFVRSATSATAGKLRLVRSDGVFTSYYWDATTSQWKPLIVGGFDHRDLPIVLFAWSGDGEFPDIASKVAFDNFVVNQGEWVP